MSCILKIFAEGFVVSIEEGRRKVPFFKIAWQLQPIPELLGFLPPQELELSLVVDLLNNLQVVVLDAAEVVLLCQALPRLLELADELILYLADIPDELFLSLRPFLQPSCETFEGNRAALHVRLNFASLAVVIGAEKRYFLAVGVDAHPVDGFIVVAVEVLRVADAEVAQHGLEVGVFEAFCLHVNKNSDKKYRFIVLITVLILLFLSYLLSTKYKYSGWE